MNCWLFFIGLGFGAALPIRTGLRRVIKTMSGDGRWDGDCRIVIGREGSPAAEENLNAARGQSPGVAPATVFHGASASGRRAIGQS